MDVVYGILKRSRISEETFEIQRSRSIERVYLAHGVVERVVSPCLHQYSFKWPTFFINYHLGLVDLEHLMSA